MDELLALLHKILEIAGRLQTVETDIPYSTLMLPVLLFTFGVTNCILGYRLMRFWMMLVGFAFGTTAAYLFVRYMEIEFPDNYVYLGVLLGAGAGFALVSFFLYRAGIFLMAAVLGAAASIYLIYPTTSASFYLCLLIGVILGVGALRYEKPVIIITTSLFGGILAGYSLARLISCPEMYMLLLSLGFVAGGCLVQFLLNKTPRKETVSFVETMNKNGYPSSSALERSQKRRLEKKRLKNAEVSHSDNGNWKGVYRDWEKESQEDMARAREDFYEEYFHGGDVFDRTTREIRELNGERDIPDVHVMAWNQKKKRSSGGK